MALGTRPHAAAGVGRRRLAERHRTSLAVDPDSPWRGVGAADLLRPGGRLFIREFHPILWTLDERADDLLVAVDPYFETSEPYVDEDEETYVETDSTFSHNTTHTWNHGLGEIIGGVLEAGMELTAFEEHRSMPSELLPGAVVRDEHEEWHLRQRPERVPLSYTLQARKTTR